MAGSSQDGIKLSPSNSCELTRSAITIQEERRSLSADICVRPCYYLLQFFGLWRPSGNNSRVKEIMYKIHHIITLLVWVTSLVTVLSEDFIRYGFKQKRIHVSDLLNSVTTDLNLLCPFVFTQIYLQRGQFTDLVLSVQNLSPQYKARLHKKARIYTWISVVLWFLSAGFFFFQWKPLFTATYRYVVYIIVIVYTSGWWAVWLGVYAYVCDVHRLQIDALIDCIRSKESSPAKVLYNQQQVRNSIDRTEQDFNFIISFAVSYHALDILIFSFAYFDHAFGKNYEIWQYVWGVFQDFISILIKLLSPALLSATVHRSINEAAKRCDVTSITEIMPQEDLQLFQYMVSCEPDMGLKILGIRITVELVGTILMTSVTVVVSFVTFVVPRLIH